MNIVFFAHFAGSPRHGMVYGHYFLAREWVRMGHEVTIVAASFAHTRFHQPECRQPVMEEFVDGIRYLWLSCPEYSARQRLGRVANIIAFSWQSYVRSLPIAAADLVISSSHHPFSIFAARKLSQKFNARLVFEVRDLWPLTLIELGGASRLNPFIMSMQWAEDFAYRNADKVVTTLENAAGYMVDHGMHPDKFVHIPNGIDPELITGEELPPAHCAAIARQKSAGKLLIGYAGRLVAANALEPLLHAVARLRDPGIQLTLLGDGYHRERLTSLVGELGLAGQVEMLLPVNRSQVPSFLAAMDALYLGYQRQDLYRYGVSPTKLSEYLLAGKPVIYAIDMVNQAMVRSRAGVLCSAEDPASIADGIRQLRDSSCQERQWMGERGRTWILENWSYPVLAKTFIEAVCAK